MDRRQGQPKNETPNKAGGGGRDGFNGTRLRQLQLARSRTPHSMDEATSKQEAFRRWQSMSDKDDNNLGMKPSSSSSSLLVDSSARTKPPTTPRVVAINASGRVKHRDGPVVYVLPEPNQERLPTSRPEQFAAAPHQKTKADLKLKYPHGMPRWGPRLVSATTSPFDDNRDPMRDYISNIGGYKVSKANDNSNSNHNNDYEDESFVSVKEVEERSVGGSRKTKSRQEAVVEKAKTQSLLAAARAAQNIAATNSSTSSSPIASNYHNKKGSNKNSNVVGLGSRLLGRHQGKQLSPSLFQSARLQQSKVMNAGSSLLRQTISLDDPCLRRHTDNNADENHNDAHHQGVTRSVQSFEYLNQNNGMNTPRPTCQEAQSPSTTNSDLEEEESTDDDDPSWDMESTGESSGAENSMDESVDDDNGTVSQDSSASSESDSIPPNVYGQERSSVPTLIHSEVDPDCCSLYSDYSSLAVNTRRGSSHGEDDEGNDGGDEFFDSAASIRTTQTEVERHRRFDARRCQELHSMRNHYLQQEERKRLISPQAVKRLTSTPALSRFADEAALQELASRGRWHLSKQKHEIKVKIPKVSPQPLASLPDDDDFYIKPISLVAPKTISPAVNTSKNLWHKPETDGSKEDAETGQSSNDVAEDTANDKHPSRVRKSSVRCAPLLLLLLLWAARAYNLLHDTFISNASYLGKTAHSQQASEPYSSKASISGKDREAAFLNLSHGSTLPGITERALPDMLFQRLNPTQMQDDTRQQDTQPVIPPPKCYANVTKQKFWETIHLLEENDTVVTNAPGFEVPEPLSMELEPSQHRPLESMFLADMSQDQTICDGLYSVCYRWSNPLSLESEETVQTQGVYPSHDDEDKPQPEEIVVSLDMYLHNSNDDVANNKSLLKKLAQVLRRHIPELDPNGADILAKVGDVLRKGAQNLPGVAPFHESDNSLFKRLGGVLLKSSENLPKVDHFHDFDDDGNVDNNLLNLFVAVLRKPSQNLKEKRNRRRELFHI